jgi:hypothetical protein
MYALLRKTLLATVALSALASALAGCNSGSSSSGPPSPYATPQPTNPPASTASFVQFERLARPAVKELFQQFANHDTTNRSAPYSDPTLGGEIVSFTNLFRAPAYGAALQSILIPDEIAADLSQTGSAAYLGVETGGATGGKFGGRALGDNVIDISLGAVFGNTLNKLAVVPVDDGQENGCLTSQNLKQAASQQQPGFPYLGAPH